MKTKTEKEEAILRLEEILCELGELGYEASELVSEISESAHREGEAYGAFDLGSSTNPYDTTLSSIFESLAND